ncbi:hypothetical protein M2163_003552 [Streptomyces sp. SAI-135]|nr:hypothetical protein [Streptomyces sp. SAI-090]MDH6616444.1 hypothetical protein [Streptomyces sp. SAI-135]
MHLLGGGHPILHHYCQRKPVTTAAIQVRHRRTPLLVTGGVVCPAPRVPATSTADCDHTRDHDRPTTITMRQHCSRPGWHPG